LDSYDRYLEDLNSLVADTRLAEHDRSRVGSVRGGAETTRNIYKARWAEDLQVLRGYVALAPTEEVELDMPEYQLSPLAAKADQPGELHSLLQQARENNPAFAVLRDAKSNADLQRQRAIKGRYDVTAFLEGTTFPVGSESFDDRYQGWTMGGGVNLRLNDRRVLKHTQLKAEAEMRQFDAEIEAEELLVRRRITTEAQALLENDRNRAQILEVLRQKAEEFKVRREDYYSGKINIDQLIETRSGLTSMESSLGSNLYNSANREARLLLATGRVYELVGLKVRHDDSEHTPHSKAREPKKP
jgi:outer membrane protein TolC